MATEASIAMAVPTYKFVEVELRNDNHVAVVKYNRPESGNSLRAQLVKDMYSALKWADNHPEVRVIVQTGNGRFFTTGMDLDEDGSGLSFTAGSEFYEWNRLLVLSDKVLIVGVNGPAVGYGVSSLGLFDLVYSVPDAFFFTPFIKWGMCAEGGSSVTFPRLMGYQKAAQLILTGERITAEEAEKIGLISKILPKENFLGSVLDIAQKLAASPPGALKATKKLIKDPVRQELLDAIDRECDVLQNERSGSEENREAIKQFKIEQEQKKRQRKSKI